MKYFVVESSPWASILVNLTLIITFGAVLLMHRFFYLKNFLPLYSLAVKFLNIWLLKKCYFRSLVCLSRTIFLYRKLSCVFTKNSRVKFIVSPESFTIFFSLLGEVFSNSLQNMWLIQFLCYLLLSLVTFIIIFWFFSAYVKKHIKVLTVYCKKIQAFLESHQLQLFIISNLVTFSLMTSVLDFSTSLIVQVVWFQIWFGFYFAEIENIPFFEGVLCSAACFLIFSAGYINVQNLCLLLFILYCFFLLDSLGVFDNTKAEVTAFQEAQNVTMSHKKEGFFYFYIVEKVSVSLLVLIVIVPSFFNPTFISTFLSGSLEEASFFLGLKILIFSNLFICSLIALVIIQVFNTKGTFALLQNCLQCASGVATIGGVCLLHLSGYV